MAINGILHHIGLVDEHKGFFSGMPIIDAIQYLSNYDKAQYGNIIVSLIRLSENLYDNEIIDLFTVSSDSKKLFKSVGISQYTDGVRIDKDFHDIFNLQVPNSMLSGVRQDL
ncbi:hypothetical protein N752_24515 [Desulforamulus aquiferis]|nr:hypothetical protein [Desulforamulus aquiferis]RYD02496.1 hypothetical protein N752_24515 [Desulforamulus aquiferis]